MSSARPRIAIIPVHGVAYHAPGSSVEEIADLLIQKKSAPQSYVEFEKAEMRLRVFPVYPNSDQSADSKEEDTQSKQELEITEASSPDTAEKEVATAGDAHKSGHANALRTDMQLRSHQLSEADAFHPVQGYKGVRRGQGSTPEAEVHLWELHWNDLSRVSNGLLGFFSTLYILLFHLGDIGGATIHWAGQEWWKKKEETGWNRFLQIFPCFKSPAAQTPPQDQPDEQPENRRIQLLTGWNRFLQIFPCFKSPDKTTTPQSTTSTATAKIDPATKRKNILNWFGLDDYKYPDRVGWKWLSIFFDAVRMLITVHLVLLHSLFFKISILYIFYSCVIYTNISYPTKDNPALRYTLSGIFIIIAIFFFLLVNYFNHKHDPKNPTPSINKFNRSCIICEFIVFAIVIFGVLLNVIPHNLFADNLTLCLIVVGLLALMYYFMVKKYLPFRPKVNSWATLLGTIVFSLLFLSLTKTDAFEKYIPWFLYSISGMIRILWFLVLVSLIGILSLYIRCKKDIEKVKVIKTAWLSIVPSVLMVGSMTQLFWAIASTILKNVEGICGEEKYDNIHFLRGFIDHHISIKLPDSFPFLSFIETYWPYFLIAAVSLVLLPFIAALLPSVLQEAAPAVPADMDKEKARRRQASRKLGKWLTGSPKRLWFSFRVLCCILTGFLLGHTISGAGEALRGWERWELQQKQEAQKTAPVASAAKPDVSETPRVKSGRDREAPPEAREGMSTAARAPASFPENSFTRPDWVRPAQPQPTPAPTSTPSGFPKKEETKAQKPAEVPVPVWVIPTIIASVGLALFAYLMLLPLLTRGVRTVTSIVGVLLDVDNYLRAFPRTATPRARMLTRYNALLEQINEQYDAVIIVAHSQGAVLSVDLLRWRALRKSLKMKTQKPVYLLTMGSPLRQLYAARFPDLYEWTLEAKPQDLKVKKWVNVFRSGDYVGRSQWKSPDKPGIWKYDAPELKKLQDDKGDFCIGEGAHTHYWCLHAPEVRGVLDELIQEAILLTSPPGFGRKATF